MGERQHGSKSPSTAASCFLRQVSHSPSFCRTATADASSISTKRSSKSKPPCAHNTSKPRPSSPVLISSTIQLVDTGSPSGLERSPSICSNVTSHSQSYRGGVHGSGRWVASPMLNSSMSNLQLQSSIRVSSLKNRHGGGSSGGGDNWLMTDPGSSSLVTGGQVAERRYPSATTVPTLVDTTTVFERSSSTTSVTTNRRTGKPIWSAFHSGHGGAKSSVLSIPVFATKSPERNRILKLKSIPSQTQISIDSSMTPTFVVPPPAASLPLFIPSNPSSSKSTYNLKNAKHANEKIRAPIRIRHSLSATSATRAGSSPLPQRDQDRSASAPSLPVSFVEANSRSGDASPTLPHSGMKMSPSLLSSLSPLPPPMPCPTVGNRRRRRRSSSSSSSNTNQIFSSRDRISSFTSQTSIATATTARTSMTNRTLSSCSTTTSSLANSQCTLIPQGSSDITSKPITLVPGAHYLRRSSSNSNGYTPASHHLHGHGREKRFLRNQSYQHRHQRQGSTTSNISFDGAGEGGNTAAASARSQAYAQLTGTATAAGMGLGLGTITNANKDVGPRRRRPSTSPGSGLGSTIVNWSPYGQRHGLGTGGSIAASTANGSASTLMPSPSSSPPYQHHSKVAHSSLISLSHYGNPSSITRTPSRVSSPPSTPSHHFSSSPKSKSILTRASSLSTKASACGGMVKSVKFVEIPEVYYRSGYYEHDGKEFIYGCDTGNADKEEDEEDEGEDGIPAVGARGEGQEGMVLRECSGMDIEAIDMDIDTYLGTHKHFSEESKEPKYGFKKMGWGFLSRGRRVEKENQREQEDESKESIIPPPPPPYEHGQKRVEKEKTTSGFGLRRLMGLTTRKAPPPPLSLSISSPAPLSPKSPRCLVQVEEKTRQRNKKQSTSPHVSPRKPISGPYVLGSHLPSRSPSTHSPMPSPSSSFLHQQIPGRPIPMSSSNTSLNKMHGGRQCEHQNLETLSTVSQGCGSHHRSRSLRNTHQLNTSLTTITNFGMNTERPVGPNVAGTRPKGFVIGTDAFLSVNAVPVPLKNASSYESFRSAKSYGGWSDKGSMRSAKSAGTSSMRTFRTWMNKIGTGVYGGVGVAVAE